MPYIVPTGGESHLVFVSISLCLPGLGTERDKEAGKDQLLRSEIWKGLWSMRLCIMKRGRKTLRAPLGASAVPSAAVLW